MTKFHGFLDYQNGLGMTPAFFKDFELMARKVYGRWSMGNFTFEDFHGFVLEKMLLRMKYYNPALSQCSTFVLNLIWYEAHRIASKESKVNHMIDFDTYIAGREACATVSDSVVDSVKDFVGRAFRLGVYVDPCRLISDFSSQVPTPLVSAFGWLRGRGVV